MASSLVTQVSRDQPRGRVDDNVSTMPAPAPPTQRMSLGRRILLTMLCQCKAIKNAGDSSNANNANNSKAPTVLTQRAPSTHEPLLLPPQPPLLSGRKCLVLDLDETLVHSSAKLVPNAHYIIPVEFEDTVHLFYVLKRPGVDEFLRRVCKIYEVVVFTASVSKYADQVMDMLDPYKMCHHRLFRESCVFHRGNYVKDLGRLGRPLKSVIIVDNNPGAYLFNPENAVPIDSWFDDPNDTELLDLAPFLEDLAKVENVQTVLAPV